MKSTGSSQENTQEVSADAIKEHKEEVKDERVVIEASNE